MKRELCAKIFYWLHEEQNFFRAYRGDDNKYYLWKTVVNSQGFVKNINIKFVERKSKFVMELTAPMLVMILFSRALLTLKFGTDTLISKKTISVQQWGWIKVREEA